MKVNANFETFASVHFDPSRYITSPSMGVNRFLLDRIGNEMARATSIVQYQPNSRFPEHEHVGGEEYLVLSGTFKDQHGEFSAGSYVRNPIGSKHAPWVDDDGCVILVKLLQMADKDEENGIDHQQEQQQQQQPLHINVNLNLDKNSAFYKSTDFGSVLELYHNPHTGERVQMCWINPNTLFSPAADDNVDCGGEELFVFDGSLKMIVNNNDDEEEEEEYAKWAWLRFPPTGSASTVSTRRTTLQAGSRGAHVYKKTGHLTKMALSMEKIQIDPETEEPVVLPVVR
jgi:quercetin dioxygenase-like cupin family protein